MILSFKLHKIKKDSESMLFFSPEILSNQLDHLKDRLRSENEEIQNLVNQLHERRQSSDDIEELLNRDYRTLYADPASDNDLFLYTDLLVEYYRLTDLTVSYLNSFCLICCLLKFEIYYLFFNFLDSRLMLTWSEQIKLNMNHV